MKSREALRILAEVTESQWGMATSAQASARGVSHMNLTRLTEFGDLVRLSHGVYKDAGTPSEEHEELHAAWLATDPTRLAYERLSEHPAGAVVSGESAARLHAIGDLRAMKNEFTTATRRQTQRPDVRYRTRVLPEPDITVSAGLPVTTRERTIADLVEDRQDLSIVANALRDAARQSRLDMDRLAVLLSPLAARNGHRKGDGDALLEELLRIGGIDQESIAKEVAGISGLGAKVMATYLDSLPKIDTAPIAAALAKQMAIAFPMDIHQKQLKVMSEALSKVVIPTMPDLSALSAAISSSGITNGHARLAEQLNTVDWASLALATQRAKKEVDP